MVEDYALQLAEDVVLWSVGEVTTAELVRCACDALIEGLDSQALRELAGASETDSQYEIEDLLERVATELDFAFYARDSADGRLAAARVLAARCAAGHLPPRELARWMHERIKHGHPDRRVEALVSADDQYDILGYTNQSEADIDRAVRAGAESLLAPE